MSEWIKVSDRLPKVQEPAYSGGPKISRPVLMSNGRFVEVGRYGEIFDKDDLRWFSDFASRNGITHWMPLPDPPAVAKK